MPAGLKKSWNCERKSMTILDQNRQILRDSLGLPSKIVIDFRSAEIGDEVMLTRSLAVDS